MISCISIDDEPLALKQINSYIEKISYLNQVESFTSALKALEYLEKNTIDLMFVDINMPDLSGMDFVKALSNPPKVIFTTAYREYAVEGFEVDAAGYLLKPIAFSSFLKTVEKTKEHFFSETTDSTISSSDDQFLFVKSEYKIIRINLKDITYIEGMRDYVRIHITDQKPIMALLSMSKITTQLPQSTFMRVHRSYIVNLKKITTIERNRIIFDKKVYIPISDQYKDDFHNFIETNFLK